MKFRKPNLVPLLFTAAATILFCALGSWQLERLAWKNAVIADVKEKRALPVLTSLPSSLDNLDYRNVKLQGHFLYDKTLHLIGRQQGTDVGYFMLAPFQLKKDNRIILVNRGFAPPGKESKPAGTQMVEGLVRPARKKRFFAPENQPNKNVWFYEDFAAIETASDLKLTPLIVEITGEMKTGEYPIPSDGQIVIRNDHLAYAITWFMLAAIGPIMLAFYLRKPQS